jgi:hypothetical protein
MTCTVSTIRPWCTGERTVGNILLGGGGWDKYYFDLLRITFESRHELWAWCEARENQLKDPVYLEEQRQLQMKAEEEKRLA